MATVAQTHTVSCGITHTQCAPLLLLGKHRCGNLARTRLSAAYPAWPTWQLQWCVSAAHPRLRVVEVHRLCPSRTPKGKVTNGQVRWCRGLLAEHLVILSTALLWSERHLAFHWRRAGKLKIYWVNVSAVPYLQKYSSKFWFYNYLKSRSVFVFTLYYFFNGCQSNARTGGCSADYNNNKGIPYALKFSKLMIIMMMIIYLSWSWANCWPVPVSRIQKSYQRSIMIPSASWGVA